MDIDLTDGAGKGADILAAVASAALDDAANDLGLVRVELAMGTAMDTRSLDAVLASAIRTMRAAGRALAGGAAVIALAAAGVVFLPGGTPHAAAATVTAAPVVAIEGPQPGPSPVVCPRHATRWDRGYWADAGRGDVYLSAPLRELVGNLGWLPSPFALVNVQQLRRGRWVTVASLQTSAADGRASGYVHVGGGVKYLRVVHPADQWTLGTTGATRRVVVTTEPLDVV